MSKYVFPLTLWVKRGWLHPNNKFKVCSLMLLAAFNLLELYKTSLYTQGIFSYLIYLGPADQDSIYYFIFFPPSVTPPIWMLQQSGCRYAKKIRAGVRAGHKKKSFCCFVINEASLNYALDAYWFGTASGLEMNSSARKYERLASPAQPVQSLWHSSSG